MEAAIVESEIMEKETQKRTIWTVHNFNFQVQTIILMFKQQVGIFEINLIEIKTEVSLKFQILNIIFDNISISYS